MCVKAYRGFDSHSLRPSLPPAPRSRRLSPIPTPPPVSERPGAWTSGRAGVPRRVRHRPRRNGRLGPPSRPARGRRACLRSQAGSRAPCRPPVSPALELPTVPFRLLVERVRRAGRGTRGRNVVRSGDFVRPRGRRWLVEGERDPGDGLSALRVACVDDDGTTARGGPARRRAPPARERHPLAVDRRAVAGRLDDPRCRLHRRLMPARRGHNSGTGWPDAVGRFQGAPPERRRNARVQTRRPSISSVLQALAGLPGW